jgi:TraM recognition site of TraD and TraG
VQRFAGSYAARAIVGQPRSTIDPAAWLRDGSIVIVNTAKGAVGEDTAALVGGTLINLVGLVVGEQAALGPTERYGLTLLVDEFHTMPGADYEAILAELAKYGANLVLATQSLARLEALDREQQRALRATVFANLDALFAFHTSAEDARYLVRELGGEVDEQDLVALGEHQCYVRLSAGGERLPVFSVRLDPPPPSDPRVRDQLATASANRYGRAAPLVDADIRSALARIELAHELLADRLTSKSSGVSPEPNTAVSTPSHPLGRTKARTRTRPRKPPPDANLQISLPDMDPGGAHEASSHFGDTGDFGALEQEPVVS